MFGEWPEQKKSKLQGWELVHRFSEGIARFCKNMSKTAISSKKQAIAHFWWVTWAIRSCSLSTLIFVEWNKKNIYKTYQKNDFRQTFLSKSLIVAHLSSAPWEIRSRLLFWYERTEQFAHSCSFVLSNLSKSLTVAHLIWAMGEKANSQPWVLGNELYLLI